MYVERGQAIRIIGASATRRASRYLAGSSVAVLEPDVAAAFPSPISPRRLEDYEGKRVAKGIALWFRIDTFVQCSPATLASRATLSSTPASASFMSFGLSLPKKFANCWTSTGRHRRADSPRSVGPGHSGSHHPDYGRQLSAVEPTAGPDRADSRN